MQAIWDRKVEALLGRVGLEVVVREIVHRHSLTVRNLPGATLRYPVPALQRLPLILHLKIMRLKRSRLLQLLPLMLLRMYPGVFC